MSFLGVIDAVQYSDGRLMLHMYPGLLPLMSCIDVNELQYGINLQRQEYFAGSIAAGSVKEKIGDWFHRQ